MSRKQQTARKVRMNNSQRVAETERIARMWVDHWIESAMMTYDMDAARKSMVEHFDAFLKRDIDAFKRTGKYPKWALGVENA